MDFPWIPRKNPAKIWIPQAFPMDFPTVPLIPQVPPAASGAPMQQTHPSGQGEVETLFHVLNMGISWGLGWQKKDFIVISYGLIGYTPR